MQFSPTSLPDVLLIDIHRHEDERGSLAETYRAEAFAAAGIPAAFVQENHSSSRRGVLRGLHYQIRQAQGKLVRVVGGRIFDVAVDLRRRSPTFGRSVGIELDGEHGQMMWIPPGFAHGLYTLSDRAEIIYKMTDYYAPEWERTLLWNDVRLKITWPLVDGEMPKVSAKDALGLPLDQAEVFE
ncbi:MAG TPA: dTDP-4-dehydrorhamnose 3,5-epimerase [Anaerolineales bacterium]|nr:dTDP-4-dehydrorhamnose 3,5-epimerase [Anaerolineales bacterium]